MLLGVYLDRGRVSDTPESASDFRNPVETRTELDEVGPVDNRPFTDKLHHFVRRKKNVKCDRRHVSCDT